MSLTRKRVVITGLGVVSPIGSDLDTLWSSLHERRSGIADIQSLSTESLPFKSGGEANNFTGSIDDYGPLDKKMQRAIKKNMKVMCREIGMGVAASQKALAHSGLTSDREPQRCGCIFGCDYILTRPEEYADGLRNCQRQRGGRFKLTDWPTFGMPKVNPLWLLKYLPNMPNSHVSIYNDFRGPNNSITLREASMNLAMAEATCIIQRGAADVMLVGATGSRIHPLRTTYATLIETLSSQRTDPAEMSRPFCEDSDGMVLGEGAGTIMLETLEHAEARGAKIWGEIIGQGAAMVGVSSGRVAGRDRDNIRESVRLALFSAVRSAGQRMPSEWHIHAHGLSSPQPDKSEALAIGDLLASDLLTNNGDIPVTAAKSYFGNLGAGGAAVELICSILALQHGELFPIRNLETPSQYVTWHAAKGGENPGKAFVHSSFTLQGQASTLAVAAAP